eukprot:7786986-Pyramimonas_sp.AAC.1
MWSGVRRPPGRGRAGRGGGGEAGGDALPPGDPEEEGGGQRDGDAGAALRPLLGGPHQGCGRGPAGGHRREADHGEVLGRGCAEGAGDRAGRPSAALSCTHDAQAGGEGVRSCA